VSYPSIKIYKELPEPIGINKSYQATVVTKTNNYNTALKSYQYQRELGFKVYIVSSNYQSEKFWIYVVK
jgi:hypothetical protein